MKTPTKFLIAALALGALVLPAAQPAHADARVVVCSAPAAGANVGSRRIVNPNTTTAYVLNAQGCAAVSSADYGWFLSQGFTPGANLFAVSKTGITAQDFTSLALPAGAYIQGVIVRETAGHNMVGGMKIGTTAGGTDIATGVTVASSGLVSLTDVSLLKRVFSATATQKVSIDANSSWNGASVDVTVLYSLF